jgi:hypothetical protein
MFRDKCADLKYSVVFCNKRMQVSDCIKTAFQIKFSSVQKHTRHRDIFSLFCVRLLSPGPESIEWFIEDHPFSSSYYPPLSLFPNPSPFSKLNRRHTGRRRKRDSLLTEERGKGWWRSQIIQRRRSMVL